MDRTHGQPVIDETGNLFASQSAQELLRLNGLGDLDAIFDQGMHVRSRHEGRSVWDVHLRNQEGGVTHAYIKMNWGKVRMWARSTDLRHGQMFHSLPRREWDGLEKLSQLGLYVPERLALLESGFFNFRSAVITVSIPQPKSIYHMMREGDWAKLSVSDRSSIFHEVVRTMRRIHGANLAWRGTSTIHFFPQRVGNSWKVWLIDCEGVHGGATPRDVQRDFKKLIKSMWQSGADQANVDQLLETIEHVRAPAAPHAA